MRSLTIRKAQDCDYEFFKRMYVGDDYHTLYKGTGGENIDPDESKKAMDALGYDMDWVDDQVHTCTEETFQKYKKSTYIIVDKFRDRWGYIIYSKASRKVKIEDITICIDEVFKNGNFEAIMDEFREKERVSYMYALISNNPDSEELLSKAGFKKDANIFGKMFWSKN